MSARRGFPELASPNLPGQQHISYHPKCRATTVGKGSGACTIFGYLLYLIEKGKSKPSQDVVAEFGPVRRPFKVITTGLALFSKTRLDGSNSTGKLGRMQNKSAPKAIKPANALLARFSNNCDAFHKDPALPTMPV